MCACDDCKTEERSSKEKKKWETAKKATAISHSLSFKHFGTHVLKSNSKRRKYG